LRKAANIFWPLVVPNVINAGVAGDSAAACVEKRLDRDALVHQPDVLIIAFGLNDTSGYEAGLERFVASLRHIIEKAQGQGVRWIVLVTPPMMATKENQHVHPDNLNSVPGIVRRQTKGILAMYAQAIRDLGQAMDVPVADVH